MADGSRGGLSGVLFEAGKTISDAGKQQAQQVAQTVFSSTTGSNKQLFNNKSQGSTPPAKPLGQAPKQNPFGNLGGMFEKGGASPFGQKAPAVQSSQPAFSQADLEAMAAQNKIADEQEIAKKQAELEAIKQQAHKARHDEVYYNKIKNIGADTMAQSRQQKEQQQQQEEAQKQAEAQQNQMQDLSGGMFKGSPLSQNGQLQPVAVQQAMTKTEAQRGSNG